MASMENDRKLGGQGQPVGISFRLFYGIRKASRKKARPALLCALYDKSSVVCVTLPNRKTGTLFPIIINKVEPGSILVYDDDIMMRRLYGYGYHCTLLRSFEIASAISRDFDDSLIISYWASLVRVVRNAHVHIKDDNLWKYLGEFNFRFNRRHDTRTTFWDMISCYPALPAEMVRSKRGPGSRGGAKPFSAEGVSRSLKRTVRPVDAGPL